MPKYTDKNMKILLKYLSFLKKKKKHHEYACIVIHKLSRSWVCVEN